MRKDIWATALWVATMSGCVGTGVSDPYSGSTDASTDVSTEELSSCVEPGTKLITTAYLNFRTYPSRRARRLELVPKDATVTAVRACPRRRYYKVDYEGTVGWLYARYLRLAPPDCSPEADSALCDRVGARCGRISAPDNCDIQRTVACGSCSSSQACVENACVSAPPDCSPETDSELCDRLGAQCGEMSAPDNCDIQRTVACGSCSSSQACVGNACVSGMGPLTDRTFQSYTGSEYTSRYHLYAAGLDWSMPVGLLVYADGSGEYGLKNPGSSYLLDGQDGLINVAKRNNMILLTPFAPNESCSDGGGSCWYLGNPVGYARWAEELVSYVQSQYPLDKSRMAFGGYSSGAQLTTEYFAPSGAASRTMQDGVMVAISYGGSPKVRNPSFTDSFKDRIHMTWDTGDRDSAWTSTSSYGVKAGYDWYTDNGFDTSLTLVEGKGHSRGGEFGRIMEREIQQHIPPAR